MIIIPARLASTRFPQKMLADILGVPLIVRTAKNASKVDEVVVACDDEKILQVCHAHKIRSVLTSKNHSSGTDRCAEACEILGLGDDEIVLNVQGDEPFLEKEVIQTLIHTTKQAPFMASLAKKITKNAAQDPNLVKVLLDVQDFAIYFSRSPIPYDRDHTPTQYLGHLGVYGFRCSTLKEFCRLKKSQLEEVEKLEQLRAIYHKKPIKMAVVETQSLGIDTPEDLQRALEIFQSPLSEISR